MEMTNDQLKEVSVKVVEGFLNDKVPLSDGIAKQASELELNSDQIKRVVEASNTIAYLKLQKEASDKTFEFPVANYEGVMQSMCIPESATEAPVADALDKQASLEEEHEYTPDQNMVQSWLLKSALDNKSKLEKIAVDKEVLYYDMIDAARKLSKQQYALEKLAEVCEEDDFTKLASFFCKEIPTLENRVFRDSELEEARGLLALYKQAKELLKEEEERTELHKKAFIGAIGNLAVKSLGAVPGAVAGAAAGGAAKAGSGLWSGARKSGLIKSKANAALTVGGTALTDIPAKQNIWDNLHGSQKRF